jgi:polyhydroxybutyrate depolymerase
MKILQTMVMQRSEWLVRLLVSAVCLLFVIGTGDSVARSMPPPPTAAEIAALGFQEKSITVDGVERWFLVQPAPDASKPAAVLVVLHGGSQSMRRIFAANAGGTRGWPELARRQNALLLVPNGMNGKSGDARGDEQNWNDLRRGIRNDSEADDEGFILKLLDWAKANHNTNQKRVYVTGASNGGIMTFRLLMEVPHRFSAGAAFVAALPDDGEGFVLPTKPSPLMIANGTEDPLIQWKGGQIAGGRGRTRSIIDTRLWWLKANRASLEAAEVIDVPNALPDDKCKIQTRYHKAEKGGADVVTVEMQGGGHNLPSAKFPLPDTWFIRNYIGPVCKDVEGVDLIWSFLSKYKADE